jgi:hypothetical protein
VLPIRLVAANDSPLRLGLAWTAGTSTGVLLDPRFDRCAPPDAAGCYFHLGGREVRVTLHNLVDALRGDAQQLGDLLGPHKVMRHSARLLDVP